VYAWKDYWANLARSYGAVDERGFAPVLHPDAPTWFNFVIDRLQEKSWRRGLKCCQLKPGSFVLDVGCGTGRWLRRYLQQQLRPIGLDATQNMLRLAVAGGLTCPVVAAQAQRLPFRNGSFELVSAITVVQHISSRDQHDVLKEMARVLRPGGHLMLIELVRGDAPHIFPRIPKDWMGVAASAGLSLVRSEGQEYLLFDQAFVQFTQKLRRLAGHKSGPGLPGQDFNPAAGAQRKSTGRVIYWGGRRIACKLSEWAEPLARKICPNTWATHGLFVFLKKNGIE
jgi:SAM-dependent methyltransferase